MAIRAPNFGVQPLSPRALLDDRPEGPDPFDTLLDRMFQFAMNQGMQPGQESFAASDVPGGNAIMSTILQGGIGRLGR